MPTASTSAREPAHRWPLAGGVSGKAGPAADLLARPFGTSTEDLDIAFAGRPRPEIVTRVLAACLLDPGGQRWGESEIWGWTVARRTQALLSVASATGGTRRETPARCGQEGCGEWMEIVLDLSQFRVEPQEAPFVFRPRAGIEFELRLPSGLDQLRFQDGEPEAALDFARSLIVRGDGGAFEAEWFPQLEAAFEERDPLTAIELLAACPACGSENRVAFDLEGFLLREFERRQRDLLDTVYRLAMVYHWSEREILALPASRKAYYLERIDREALA